MPLDYEVSAVFDITAQQYMRDRFTHQFRRFLAKENKASRIAFIDAWEQDGRVFIKQSTSPDVAAWLPANYAPYVKFYTDSIEYVDVMEFPAELTHPPYIIHINTRPAFTETVSTTSTLTIHATEDGKCRQVLKGTIRCSIPAIGGYVETYLRDSLQRLYTTYHQLVTKWVENRDALLRDSGEVCSTMLIPRPPADLVNLVLLWGDDGVSAQVGFTREQPTGKQTPEEELHPLRGEIGLEPPQLIAS